MTQLKRALSLPGLLLFGIVLIQPTAPMPLFGAAAEKAQGHVVTTILIGMVAMLFTAISYGRMASAHPSAGSAYAYASAEIHPAAGYVVGWGMVFDYVMNPVICAIWCSKALMNFLPALPFAGCIVGFALLFTALNLRGIEASTRTNAIIAVCLGGVIVLFLAAAVRALWLQPPADAAAWGRPFYDPGTFSFGAISAGASLAVLTYIGFDGISTLAEEARDPQRNIFRATVLVCVVTGVLASVQVYFAQLIWPGSTFPDVDTAFVHVAGKAGGPWLFNVVNFALLVATIGSGTGAMLGAARLLYGMGRAGALPAFFASVHPRTQIPGNNVLLLGGLTLIGALTVSFSLGAELLNFGALIAFMGVNVACFIRTGVRATERRALHYVPPVLGFVVCFYLWLSLSTTAKLTGFAWLGLGVAYGLWRLRQKRVTAPAA